MHPMNQISLEALNEAAAGKCVPGTLTCVWARTSAGIPQVALLVDVNADLTRWALAQDRQFSIRTFREGDIHLVLLTLRLGQVAYELWLDYWNPALTGAQTLQSLAQQEHLAVALCTSQRVAGAITIANQYQRLLADLITHIQRGRAWTMDDFAVARDAIRQRQPAPPSFTFL